MSITGHEDLGGLGTLGMSGVHRWHKVRRERKVQTHKMHSGEYLCAVLGVSFLKSHFA